MYSKDNPRSKDPSLYNILTDKKVVIKGNVHQVFIRNRKVKNQKHWDSLTEKEKEFGRTKGHEISEDNRSRTKAIKGLAINVSKDFGFTISQIAEALDLKPRYVKDCPRYRFAVSSYSLYTGKPYYSINQDALRITMAFIKTGRHTMTDVQLAALDHHFSTTKIDGKTIWEHIDPHSLCRDSLTERQTKDNVVEDSGYKLKETWILDDSLDSDFSADVEITF